jgi:hypothetical protein
VLFGAGGHSFAPPLSGDLTYQFVHASVAGCEPPAAAPPSPGGGPLAAPVLSGLALKPARFHVGGRRGGTKVLFRLTRASGVTLAFDRLLPGRRAKAKKVKGHKRGKAGKCSTRTRRGAKCTVVKRVGRLVLVQSKLHAGSNTIAFSGKLGRKALAPGRYRLTATPAGGKARTVTFVVVKAPKPKHATKRTTHR